MIDRGNSTATLPTSSLLHNSGGPVRTVLTQSGRSYGQRLDFSLPFNLTEPVANASDLLQLLDGKGKTRAKSNAANELRKRLNAHALTLPFPAVSPATELFQLQAPHCEDLLTIMTVLAKSSAHVYLRDKEPILDGIRPGRRVVLMLSPDWRSK